MNLKAAEITNEQILAITCENLGSVLTATDERELQDPLLPVSSLYAALELLGKIHKIKFKFPADPSERPLQDQIDRIARLSGMNYRSIGLKSLLNNFTPISLLGFYGAHKDPVILKLKKGKCTCIDPKNNKARSLSQQEIDQLDDRVFQFYRSIPNAVRLPFFSMIKASLKCYWQEMNVVLGLGVLIALASLFFPFANKLLFDNVFNTSDTSYLVQLSLGLATISIASSLFMLVERFTIARLHTLTLHDMQMSIWGLLFSSSTKILKKFTVGEIFERIEYFKLHQQNLGEQALTAILNVVFSLLYLGLMFFFSVPLALGTCFVSFIGLLMLWPIVKIFLHLKRKFLLLDNKLVSRVVQFIRGIQTIRTTNSHHRFFAAWATVFIPAQKVKKEIEFAEVAFSSLVSIIPFFVTLLVYFIVIIQIIGNEGFVSHNITTGNFLAFTAALSAFVQATFMAGHFFFEILTVNPSWVQVQEVLSAGQESPYVAQSFTQLRGEISIENVSFAYDRDKAPILKNINLNIRQGDFIGIIGPTGCGKSTLLRLLIGLEHQDNGSIRYDGNDLRQWDLVDLRSQIGCVLQNSTIIDGSLMENIAVGRRIDEKLIHQVIKKAALEEFVESLPMGLHTHLSYGGTTISQGQRQRVLIARALVNNPRVILFDEATSALDNISQHMIAKNLEKLDITRIVVAHRHSTLREANRIYNLKDGILEEL